MSSDLAALRSDLTASMRGDMLPEHICRGLLELVPLRKKPASREYFAVLTPARLGFFHNNEEWVSCRRAGVKAGRARASKQAVVTASVGTMTTPRDDRWPNIEV